MTDAAAGAGFWDWSLKTYRAEGVEARLLTLQDKHALNVNILLWCAWVAERFSKVDDIVLRKAIDLTSIWSREVVNPIRNARRALKSPPREAPPEAAALLRGKLKDAELDAEKIEQDILADLAERALAPRFGAVHPLSKTRRLMARYAELAGAVRQPGFSTLLIDELARAVYPRAEDSD